MESTAGGAAGRTEEDQVYACVLILLCVCPHTTLFLILLDVSSYYNRCVLILQLCVLMLLLCMFSHSTIHVSSYYYICDLILLCVSSYYNCVCPHATSMYVFSHCYICVLHVSSHYYMCPHTATPVFSYYYFICALMLLYVLILLYI